MRSLRYYSFNPVMARFYYSVAQSYGVCKITCINSSKVRSYIMQAVNSGLFMRNTFQSHNGKV